MKTKPMAMEKVRKTLSEQHRPTFKLKEKKKLEERF